MSNPDSSNAARVVTQLEGLLEQVLQVIHTGAEGEPQYAHNLELANITMNDLVYNHLQKALNKLSAESKKGIPAGTHWQSSDGTVLQLATRDGRFVAFEREVLNRTRRAYTGEVKGSISMKGARELGYVVEGK